MKKSNVPKKRKENTDSNVGIRQEWRHFKPKEKVFILKAVHTCTSAKDVGEVTVFVSLFQRNRKENQ